MESLHDSAKKAWPKPRLGIFYCWLWRLIRTAVALALFALALKALNHYAAYAIYAQGARSGLA